MTIKTHGRMFTDNTVGITQLNVTDGTDSQALVTDGAGSLRFATVGAGGSVGSSVYVEDIRAGDGSTATFTLSTAAPYEESILVFIDGVAQPTSSFTLPSTTSITFSPAPAASAAIRICHLGIASSVANNAITGAKIAMGSDQPGDVIYFNGTDYQRLGIGTASQHLATNAGATAPEWVTPTTYATEAYADAAGSGKVLQVKSHHVTTIASISVSAHTWTDVGVSLAITPSSTGSKIWVTGNLSMGHNGYGGMRILRDSTAVVSSTSTPELRAPTHAGSQASGGNVYDLMQSTANAVDAPSTTSAITYKYQWWHNDTITIYRNRESSDSNHANRTYAVSTITLIELEDSTITTA